MGVDADPPTARQTWEDPNHTDPGTNCKGDNDPIDICDISERVCTVGEIKQVKVLGIMAMIDEGETDWKVIGIDVNDPNAAKINDVDDIDKVMPGQLAATNEWFRIYKIPAGKPENTFAFNGDAKNRDFAIKVIEETMEAWKKMVTGDGFDKVDSVPPAAPLIPGLADVTPADLVVSRAALDHVNDVRGPRVCQA